MKRFLILLILFFSFTYILADDLEELVKTGNQFFSTGELEKAKVKYLASLAEKKDDPSILYNLGNVSFKLLKYQESLTYYQDAIKQKPNDYLMRNLYYHMGNAQQALAHENMQNKTEDNKQWDEIIKILDATEISTSDKNQRVIFKKVISELKNNVKDKNFEKANKSFSDIEEFSKKANDKTLIDAVSKAKPLLGEVKEENKTKNLELQIEKVKKSIAGYEDAFQSFRKSLEISRKIAIKEGRDIAEVGTYIKNNWAIGRERWSLLYEELNRLMKENLKLKEGVADLIHIQEDLYNRLEQVYMSSQQQEILDYNLKVLAEFHTDYKQDIVQLEKIADDDLNAKKTELENLKNTQKQAQGKNGDQEKLTYEKQEKEISVAEKIANGMRSVEGFENFIEDGLKRGDLFNARRYAFQMLTFLKSLNDYLSKTTPIDRTFNEVQNQLNTIAQSMKEIENIKDIAPDVKDTIADMKYKTLKIIHEKFIDNEYLNEQLCGYLEDYIKEGSLENKNKNEKETPESKWLLEVLNSFAKTVVNKIVEDLKKSQVDSKKIREDLVNKVNVEKIFSKFKEGNNQQFATFKNTLLGVVEGVQLAIDKLNNTDENVEEDNKIFYDLLNDKLVFLVKEMEKDNTPEAFKNVLPVIKLKLQSYQEKYAIIFDSLKDKELKKTSIAGARDDLSKIIFYIDPVKTMNYKLSKLIEADGEIFKTQENASKQKIATLLQLEEIKTYFDILINSLAKQNSEPPKDNNKKEEDKKGISKEEVLQDWKKSFAVFNNYEKGLKTIDFGQVNNYELFNSLHKVYTTELQLSALRFQHQPQQAPDSLKLSIGMQQVQKEVSKEITDKRWKDQIDNPSLDLVKGIQQEILELVGVRGINQVMKMKEDEEKGKASAPQQPAAPGNPPEKKIDFDAALTLMKEAISEGDKIISFYEVREFSNTPEKHDKVITALTKALEILEKKNQDQDKNKDQDKDKDKKEEQKGEEQQAAAQEKEGGDKGDSDKNKAERKPLELSAEQARQLLNDLNKKDEGLKKEKEKKQTINTPRPW